MRIVAVFLGCMALASCSHATSPSPLPASAPNNASALPLLGTGYKTIFRFSLSKGLYPFAGLIDVKGTLYGTTTGGGGGHDGAVFKLTTAGTEKVIHSFKGGSDGAGPGCGILIFMNGALYGTTQYGGSRNNGTVFKVTAGIEKVLYSFKGGKDGANPVAALADVGGTLYGTTQYGGTGDNGTVFKITTTGLRRYSTVSRVEAMARSRRQVLPT